MNHSRRALLVGAGIGAVGVILAGTGVGYASNGQSFLLGHTNRETTTSSLKNTQGPAVRMVAPAGTAPFAVSNGTRVPNLNADRLDGVDAAAFQRKGAVVRQGQSTFTPSEGPINRQSRAWCQPGEHAVGGGGHVVALTPDRLGEYYTFIVHSAPIAADGEPAADGTQAVGWLVEATNTANAMTGQTGRNADLVSYVICQRD